MFIDPSKASDPLLRVIPPTPGVTWQCLEILLVVTAEWVDASGILRVEVGEATQHPTMYKAHHTPTTTKNYLIQNAYGAAVGQPCSKLRHLREF